MSEHHEHDHHAEFTEPPSDIELRVKALESLLVEKGLADSAAIDAIVDRFEHKVGPRNGAQVVAKAWSNPEYKRWLLEDSTAAIASMGYIDSQGEQMRVIENTDDVHNLVVCTLCSCYPWPVTLASRLCGTSRRRIVPRQSRTRGVFFRGSEPSSQMKPKSASGTRRPRCVSSSCLNVQRAPRVGARSSWRRS